LFELTVELTGELTLFELTVELTGEVTEELTGGEL
jgi:hypothetical protein